ncbi:MAG: hypothetical protein ACTSU5_07300 [Promethearchaeota archaeon]
MIRDLYIIKNGIPVVSKSWRATGGGSRGGLPPHVDDTMITGFLSAMASFVEEMGEGQMREIKTSSRERFSFYRPPRQQDLLFVARADALLNQKVCQTFLRRVSGRFMKDFGAEVLEGWKGKAETFNSFQERLDDLSEYIPERYLGAGGDADESDGSPRGGAGGGTRCRPSPATGKSWVSVVPVLSEGASDIPREELVAGVCHGLESKRVLLAVDGRKSISEIASTLQVPPERVFQFCKSLIKVGVLALTSTG